MKYDDMNLATDVFDVSAAWAFVARVHIDGTKAVATNTTAVLVATNLAIAAEIVTTGITSPTTPRNLEVVGDAAGIVGNVTVIGTNYAGAVISEVFALNGVTTVVGAKAFKTVTEIDLPAYTNAATDAVSVGVGDKLGLPYKVTFGVVLAAFLNKVKEATAPTLTTDAVNIENNSVALASALNGDDVDVFLIV